MEVNPFHWTMSTLNSAYAIQSWQLKGPTIQLFSFSSPEETSQKGPWEGKTPHHTPSAQKRTEAWNESCYSKGHIPHPHREWLGMKWPGSSGWLTSRRMDNVKCKFMGAVFYLWRERKSIQTQIFPALSSQHILPVHISSEIWIKAWDRDPVCRRVKRYWTRVRQKAVLPCSLSLSQP